MRGDEEEKAFSMPIGINPLVTTKMPYAIFIEFPDSILQ
jgi:hypothetical protein